MPIPPKRARLALGAIFVAALVILGVGIEKSRVAEAFSDPVSHIRAQDESIYANGSITMALKGDWLTPKILGRIFLYKPPLQLWLSGFCLKLFGISLWALRLPMLLAGALGAVLVCLWCVRSGSRTAGLAGTLLLLSDPVWHVFSRLAYTDMLLAFFTLAALYCAVRDPALERRSSFLGFSTAAAAAIMTKNVAGVLPVLILLLAAAWSPQRPAFRRIVQACLLTALLAAPWHVYQLIVHPRWFWMDYVQLELLKIGLRPPEPTTPEFPLIFYSRRMFLVDPVLSVLALIAIPGLWMAVRRRNSMQATLLAAWLIVAIAAMCAFQTRYFHYSVLLIVPLSILAACYGPRWRPWMIAVLSVVFCVKSLVHDRLWSLTFGRSTPMAAATILRSYSDLARPNALVLVEGDDDFYAATLPLPKVHYCFTDPNGVTERFAPHYVQLGITVSVDQFAELGKWEPQFREKLHEWGLDSDAPIATAIVAKSDQDVLTIVRSHPLDDFYLPARFRAQLPPTHDISQVSPDRIMLFARSASSSAPPRPTAHWSKNW